MNSKVIFQNSCLYVKSIFAKTVVIDFEDIQRIEIIENKSRYKIIFLILYVLLVLIVLYFSMHFPTYLSVLSIILVYLLMFHFLNLKDHYLIINSTNIKSLKVRLPKKDIDNALELINYVISSNYTKYTQQPR